MAADSDGTLTAVVICEGNVHDPDFPKKFKILLGKLKTILQQPKSKKLKVNKVEPWNSVRVTLSIPKDAATRLRQLASEGSGALRALGILSVQLEGDTVISLRLAGQEIVLRTDNNQATCIQEAGPSNGLADLSRMLASPLHSATASCTTLPVQTSLVQEPITVSSRVIHQSPTANAMNPTMSTGTNFDKSPIFKSPNTICPMDGKLPMPPVTNIGETREYPFESMTQARVIQRRENTMAVAAAALVQGQIQPPTIPSSASSMASSSQQMLVADLSQQMVVGQTTQCAQTSQSIPPLTSVANVPKTLVVSQEQTLKSHFVQPPPPPYPNSSKTLAVQHQANTITLPINTSVSNGNNNIAISSPLLVNLLQNDGVAHVKQHHQTVVAQKASVVVQRQSNIQAVQSQLQTIATNVKSSQQQLNSAESNQSQAENVLLQSGQVVANNSSANKCNINTNSNLNPSVPVPSLTISNVSALNNNQISPLHNSVATTIASQTPNSNLLGSTQSSINIRLQQPQHLQTQTQPQQQRFPHQVQAQVLLRQQQQVHPATAKVQKFSSSTQQIINVVPQQQFRNPAHQPSSQSHQYSTPPASPHLNAIASGHGSIPMQAASNLQLQQPQAQQQQQQIIGTNYNHPRWPFKPMDSATKSSFQEFTRYQIQYNLQQQMNQIQSVCSNNTTTSAVSEKSNLDPLGLSTLSDLDELTKNDLDSLLPNLSVSDLDSALGLDDKNALESLLDAKDLDLDLIDQDLGPTLGTEFESQPLQSSSSNNANADIFPEIEKSLTSSGKQRQYLINPLTGELEPMPSEESDVEPESERTDAFHELNSEVSNSLYSEDENSCSTGFSKTSDHSDTERSSNSEASVRSRYSRNRKERKDLNGGAATASNKKKVGLKSTLLREKLQQGIKEKISGKTKQSREKSSKTKLITSTSIDNKDSPAEKIKLRLKLEKSEPVTPAYKVDISFVQSPKRVQTLNSPAASTSSISSSIQSTYLGTPSSSSPVLPTQTNSNQIAISQSLANEELRVPPLHISLRGKNSIIIRNSKKDRKKSYSGGEEDDNYFKKTQIKRNQCSPDDQISVNSSPSNEESGSYKNSTHAHLTSKIPSHGKPITKQSTDEYVVRTFPSKLISSSAYDQIVENGEDSDNNVANKNSFSSKRNATELINSPNGTICPESKRRRMSQTSLEYLAQEPVQPNQEFSANLDSHIKGPIGSTNVGTLPQHSILSKNQKSANNISTNFNNKSGKNIKSGKPLVVAKTNKSSNFNVMKESGKSFLANPSSPNFLSSTASVTCTTSEVLVTSICSGRSTCLMPQSNLDIVGEEKFKRKFLDCKNVNSSEIGSATNINGESNEEKCKPEPKLDALGTATFTPPGSVILINSLSNKSTNSSADFGKDSNRVMKLKDSDEPINYINKSSNNLSRQMCTQNQENATITSPNRTKTSGNESANQSAINVIANNSNNTVRNSPGSQAQGEDSGIESMDALSEKSPHQTASPQQGDQSQKQLAVVHNKTEIGIKQVSMTSKDIIMEEITNIGDIEAALAKMEGINEHFLKQCESPSQKFNGDIAIKDETLLQNLTDDKIAFCTPKIEHNDLSEIMLENSGEEKNLECRDMNENNDISSKTLLEPQLVDECCKILNAPSKLEASNTKVLESEKEFVCISLESDVIIRSGKGELKMETLKKQDSKEELNSRCEGILNKGNLSNKDVLTPITIDIPVHMDADAHRVRTRASSKLESPLDLPKQIPTLDSPLNNIKGNLRLPSQAPERLSPKNNTGKGIVGSAKRKRQGSESSVQSCVSDDMSNKGSGANSSNKRNRQNNVSAGNGESVNNNTAKISSNSTKKSFSTESCSSARTNPSKVKKNDESSDSDEPLIEVAGKVRNSKTAGKANADAEKVLRNHRTTQLRTTSAMSTTGGISNSSKAIRGANISASTFSANNGNAHSASTISNVANYFTRGNNQISSADDKIGTRRSVRASAAANKIIYSKNTGPDSSKSGGSRITSSTVEIVDARRKTRSAVGSEISSEGRRRRGSRDCK